MKRVNTSIEDCFIIEPTVFNDKRGYFLESYNKKKFNELAGFNVNFVQDNEAFSSKGVLRGLHYQIGKHAQAKLVRVLKGKVLDVCVDVRNNSKTFGQHVAIELSEENKKQLFVPKGFAHGYVVLSDTAVFAYKCDNFYNKESEGGINYKDITLNIDWQLPTETLIVSEKDVVLPNIKEARL